MKKIISLTIFLFFSILSILNAYEYHPVVISPKLSPDSQVVYFTAGLNEEAGWQLFCMRTDGTGLKLIDTPQLQPFIYSISPDGKKIAFIAHRSDGNGGTQLYIINNDGTGLSKLDIEDVAQSQPVWTSDGKRIILTASFGKDRGEYLISIKPDGTDLKQLTKFGAGMASGSKNGKLLFKANRKGKSLLGIGSNITVMEMNEDGTGLKQLFAPKDEYRWLTVSSDGGKLLFLKATEQNTLLGLWVSDRKRKNVKRLSAGKDNEASSDNDPSWSDDSSKIVYTRGNYGEVQSIWIMNSDGTNNRQIASFEKYLTARDRVIISASDKTKKYVNDKYGFRFDYPEDWVVEPVIGETSIGIKPLNWEEHRSKSIFEINDYAVNIKVVQGDLDVAAQEAGFERMKDLRDAGSGNHPWDKEISDQTWMIMGRMCQDQVPLINTDYCHGLQGESLYGSFTKEGKRGGMRPFYVTILTNDNKICLIISWTEQEDDDVIGEIYDKVIKSLKFSDAP